MKQLSADDVVARKVTELGLDATALDLTSVEAAAQSLRRAAGFLCPCAGASLVNEVIWPLRGLIEDIQATRETVEATFDAMVAHGDLLEQTDIDSAGGEGLPGLIYAAPPAFVARQSGTVILTGIAPDYLPVLSGTLEARVEYTNHLRRLVPEPGEDLLDELLSCGLIELSPGHWLRAPAVGPPEACVSRADLLLDAALPSRDVPGLLLLDPEHSVQYYPARWVEPGRQTGRFVARREQAYGAPLWCYVQLSHGVPERVIDFPSAHSMWRGCDEAWHLQMAIDARRGRPQRVRVRPAPNSAVVLEFFSPVPMWAQRRWDAIAEPLRKPGCLLAYLLPAAEWEEEQRFLRDELWLAPAAISTPSP